MEKSQQSVGIGFPGLLTLLFIALKLMHQITWPWIWVLSPLWIGAGFWFLIIIILIAVWIAKHK